MRTRSFTLLGRSLVLAVTGLAVALIFAAPARAEGYNKGLSFGPDRGWGGYSSDERVRWTGVYRFPEAWIGGPYTTGPHGGYRTTTSKCADCHSTHYAYGSYMLLRADSRTAACDFCHGGGGGATTNIMMDNVYSSTAASVAAGASVAEETTGSGPGTGHTLGYTGRAPDDLRPAFQAAEGLACFDCHTPHGNSARVLGTFIDPGRQTGTGEVGWVQKYRWNGVDPRPVETTTQELAGTRPIDVVPLDVSGGWLFMWSLDAFKGNIVTRFDVGALTTGRATGDVLTWKTPIQVAGRYLLLKNPDNEYARGKAGDLDVSTSTVDGSVVASDGANKIAIDWDRPLGPAMVWFTAEGETWHTGANERFEPKFPFALDGLAAVDEMCVDCHDGAAGLSDVGGEVWSRRETTYTVAYSHDVQPRNCARQLFLQPGDQNDFGPSCRQCHVGSGSCEQCHADPALTGETALGASAWVDDTSPEWSPLQGYTTYEAEAYEKQKYDLYQRIDSACLDGGFTYPHRTLGYRMLKDSLWGVDFDGTPIAAGEIRASGMTTSQVAAQFGQTAASYFEKSWRAESLVNTRTHDLDSVCIDCHGDGSYWNGDDQSYFASFTVDNYLSDRPGQVPSWEITGWDLLLKGLP